MKIFDYISEEVVRKFIQGKLDSPKLDELEKILAINPELLEEIKFLKEINTGFKAIETDSFSVQNDIRDIIQHASDNDDSFFKFNITNGLLFLMSTIFLVSFVYVWISFNKKETKLILQNEIYKTELKKLREKNENLQKSISSLSEDFICSKEENQEILSEKNEIDSLSKLRGKNIATLFRQLDNQTKSNSLITLLEEKYDSLLDFNTYLLDLFLSKGHLSETPLIPMILQDSISIVSSTEGLSTIETDMRKNIGTTTVYYKNIASKKDAGIVLLADSKSTKYDERVNDSTFVYFLKKKGIVRNTMDGIAIKIVSINKINRTFIVQIRDLLNDQDVENDKIKEFEVGLSDLEDMYNDENSNYKIEMLTKRIIFWNKDIIKVTLKERSQF